jgi:Putative zinc-finger
MECPNVELHLSEYLERSLPAEEMRLVAEHLHECRQCGALLEEMRSALATCQSFPVLEPGDALIERVLLRTSGRPRTRSLMEVLTERVFRPMFTPRFAVGAVLASLFLVLVANFMWPRVSSVASGLSPREVFRMMDRGVQGIYGEGLKLYDKKNEWQEEFTFFKNNLLNRLGFMMERWDVPVEGKKKSQGESQQQQEKAPGNESSLLLLPS